MASHRIIAIVMMVMLIGIALAPASAMAQPNDVDECMNADRGPGDGGPPGFVADLVPNFISDLIGALPVPNFVKSFFGAPTC